MTDQPDLPARIEALLAAASPGPWVWAGKGSGTISVGNERYAVVATVFDPEDHQHHTPIVEANARLAALAPAALQCVAELVRVLVAALRDYEPCDHCWGSSGKYSDNHPPDGPAVCRCPCHRDDRWPNRARAALRATEERLGGRLG